MTALQLFIPTAERMRALGRALGTVACIGDRFFLEIQNHLLPDDRWLMAELAALGKARRIDLIATTDVHYAHPARRELQDVLTCIRTKTTLAEPSPERLPNAHFGLKSTPRAVRVTGWRFDPFARMVSAALGAVISVLLWGLDFIDRRTPDGTVGVIGAAMLICGFIFQVIGA